jgi:hypothetical protein
VLSAGTLLANPAIAQEEDSSKKERTCLHVNSINGFNPIDKRHLTVSVGANKVYLVTLKSNCRDLKWNQSIAIKATSSWTCSNSHDKIYVGEQRCFIDDIERVESHAKAKLMVSGNDNP